MSIPFNYSINSCKASTFERFVGSLFDFSKTRYEVISKKPNGITPTSTLLILQEKIETAPFRQNALKVAALFTVVIPLIALIYKIVQMKKWSSSTYVRIQSAANPDRFRVFLSSSSTMKIPSINEKTNDPNQLVHLVLQHLFGAGVPMNRDKAKEFLDKALKSKSALAMVAQIYFDIQNSGDDLEKIEQGLEASAKIDPVAKAMLAYTKDGTEETSLLNEAVSTRHWYPITIKAMKENKTLDDLLPAEKIKSVSLKIAQIYDEQNDFEKAMLFYQYGVEGNTILLLNSAEKFLNTNHLVEARSFVEQAFELGSHAARDFAWKNEATLKLTDKLLNSPTVSKEIKIKYLIHIYEASSSETINTRDFYGKKAVDFGSKEFELKDDGHYYLKPNEETSAKRKLSD